MEIYVITGQTATGKTAYALDLALKVNGEIINADARQVYKYLTIVTGKDIDTENDTYTLIENTNETDIGFYTVEHRKKMVNIWLYDMIEPDKSISTFQYTTHALSVIKKIIDKGKTPIVVGGSYLYIHQLMFEIDTENIAPNKELREELAKLDTSMLQKRLHSLNIDCWNNLNESDKHNPHRLIRKIEIQSHILNSGKTLHKTAEFKLRSNFNGTNVHWIGLKHTDTETARKKIADRVLSRIKNGAVNEMEQLLRMNYIKTSPGFNAIGYKQITEYLNQTISLDRMIVEWTTREVQYAKRQITFAKKNPLITWIQYA